eukprot:1153556-Pelagomonas_calceolata.AAC.8
MNTRHTLYLQGSFANLFFDFPSTHRIYRDESGAFYSFIFPSFSSDQLRRPSSRTTWQKVKPLDSDCNHFGRGLTGGEAMQGRRKRVHACRHMVDNPPDPH